MTLSLYNTLSHRREPFVPLIPGQASLYVCGITPYDECHLGHARCYVTFDVLRRVLTHAGFRVTHVQNFTDIDDKIIRRAQEQALTPKALAEKHIAGYFSLMDRLHVLRAHHYPRVSESIPVILKLVERLVEQGFAYGVGGDVYFSVRQYPGYGKLSRHALDDLLQGARVEVDERKRDPLDFALWKSAKPGEPSWESPWGLGRPGWHIECSAMSLEAFGQDTFDIHGGGLDLVFPHHENEIAQSEAALGRPFARLWVHNGFVTLRKEKMSKSLGNIFSLKDLLGRYDPRALRLMLLSQHYRTPLDFSEDLLQASSATVRHTDDAFHRLSAQSGGRPETAPTQPMKDRVAGFQADFDSALNDDLNSPQALAAFFSLLSDLSNWATQPGRLPPADARYALHVMSVSIGGVLGLDFHDQGTREPEVEKWVAERDQARREKRWAEADRLRDALTAQGITVEDTPEGARWWRRTKPQD